MSGSSNLIYEVIDEKQGGYFHKRRKQVGVSGGNDAV